MTSVRKSLLLSFAQRNSTLAIQFVSSLIVARLLTPHEIGIFAIGTVIVSFCQIIREMGVTNYIVQERELTTERLRTAQAIVWITSYTIGLMLLLGSSWAGAFYSEPGVTLSMRVLAINFLFLPIGVVTVALVRREMEFGKLFVINVCSSLTQALIGIFLAWSGFGFVSLAWASVAGSFALVLGSLAFRRRGQPWLPSLREWRRVFSVGTKLSGSSIFSEIGLGGPELVTGRILGFEAVAYLSRGFGAAMMLLRALVDSLMAVAIPYFAKRTRTEQDVKVPYLRAVTYMSGIALPAFACLGVLAEPVIVLLYGEQWLGAVMPLQIACAGLACLALSNIGSSVLVGGGQIDSNFRMLATFQPAKVLLVVFGAMFFGLKGVAIGVAIGDIALAARCLYLTNRHAGVSLREFVRAVLPSIGVMGGVVIVAWATLLSVQPMGAVTLQLALAAVGSGIAWIAGLALADHPLWQELMGALHRLRQGARR